MESQGKEGAMAIESEHPELRELDHRSGDGFDVTLLWSARTGRVFVAVEDTRTNDAFRIAVDPRDALEAFHHPYAYGCRRGRPMTVAGERRAAAESHEG
jgi:hypothetical protein